VRRLSVAVLSVFASIPEINCYLECGVRTTLCMFNRNSFVNKSKKEMKC